MIDQRVAFAARCPRTAPGPRRAAASSAGSSDLHQAGPARPARRTGPQPLAQPVERHQEVATSSTSRACRGSGGSGAIPAALAAAGARQRVSGLDAVAPGGRPLAAAEQGHPLAAAHQQGRPAPASAGPRAPISAAAWRRSGSVIEGDRSHQSQTLSAASHSCSRTNRWRDRADWRQSIGIGGVARLVLAELPEGLAHARSAAGRARPAPPWRRRARPRPAAPAAAGSSASAAWPQRVAPGRGKPAPRSQPTCRQRRSMTSSTRDALGAGGEADRHAMAQHRAGQRHHVLDRGGQPAVEQRPRPAPPASGSGWRAGPAPRRSAAPGPERVVLGPAGPDQVAGSASTSCSPIGMRRTSRCMPHQRRRRRAPARLAPRAPVVVAIIIRRSASSDG